MRKPRSIALLALSLLLTACGVLPILRAGPPIVMRHPGTGQRVECEAPPAPTGPYGVHGTSHSARMQRECIEDYKQQGFVRAPE